MSQPPYPGPPPPPNDPQQPYGQQPPQQPWQQPQQPQQPPPYQPQQPQYPPQQPAYGQPPAYTPQQPAYGQPQFGAPQDQQQWQQPWQQPAVPPKKKAGLGLYFGIGGGALAAIIIVIVLVVALNGSASTPPADAGPSDDPGVTANDANLVYMSLKPTSLLPGHSGYEPENTVLSALYAGLTRNDPVSGMPVNRIAESVTSTDSKTWTIKLRSGFTFHDGEPVTASSFVDAWNYVADEANAMSAAFFFERFEGFEGAQGSASTMSGLAVQDDLTFTVTLVEPWVVFPTALSYPALSPMARACLDAMSSCETMPIGNGPFRMDGPWSAGTELTLLRNDAFAGDKPQYGSLEFMFVDDPAIAYPALAAGEVDVARVWDEPPNEVETVTLPIAQLGYIGFPTGKKPYQSADLRRAVSLSIDREEIIETLGLDYMVPADSFTPPGIVGHNAGSCGDCSFQPEIAKELFEKAKWPKGEHVEFAHSMNNAVAAQYLELVCASVTEVLGADCDVVAMESAEFSGDIAANGHDTPWASGWIPDQANVEAFLRPLYGTGNYFGYSNPAFDDLVAQGNAKATMEEAFPLYLEAERLMAPDLPLIPFSTERYIAGHSERIVRGTLQVDPSTEAPLFDLIQVTG
ncbi:ABC transporter substrate-binding protein [Phytomonospora sp. NPDC050363]|uniref:ABC transporter substrate-binding protein n=1 Tax=Phytomonospora sp. NPDC050363 TaxID=3155642 RepID=UPI00340E5470